VGAGVHEARPAGRLLWDEVVGVAIGLGVDRFGVPADCSGYCVCP
jgi:hypothetical protein